MSSAGRFPLFRSGGWVQALPQNFRFSDYAEGRIGPSKGRAAVDVLDGISLDMEAEMQLVAEASAYAQDWMSQYDASHDWSHVQRVLNMALHLMKEEGRITGNADIYDQTVVTLAALLHDVGDRKYMRPEAKEDPKSMVHDFLAHKGAAYELAARVQDVINHVSYSNEVADPTSVTSCLQRHPELAVVQDADRLDALGAVGISRCFTYSAIKGDQEDSINDSLAHFESKLLKLERMMKTQSGRIEAQKRSQVIRDFMTQWQVETTAPSD